MAMRPKKPNPLENFREIDRKLQARIPEPQAPSPLQDPEVGRRFDALRDVAVSLGAAADLRDILDRVVDGILLVANCERGFVILKAPDGSFATYTGRRRDRGDWDEKDARQISGTIVERVIASKEPFVGSDLHEMDDLRARESIHQGRIRSAVCLPLLNGDQLTGVIYADSTFVNAGFPGSDRSALQLFSVYAAIAIEGARREGELKHRGDRLEEQNLSLARQLSREFAMGGMVSRSKSMLAIFETVKKIAPSEINVLLQGESGTGKELLARAIHEKSARSHGPFEAVNCAGIPLTLAQSILFGHRKGSYTSADYDKPGVFEVANGGTLFLDEIGDLPLEIQPSLLRVLQEREVTRLGEDGRVRPFDVRIISATNLDLARAVDDGVFRKDLFYRLNDLCIDVPPLRERREDIIPLAEYFLSCYAEEKKLPPAQLSPEARTLLLGHTWPGNVRELKSVVEGGIVFQGVDRVIHAKALERFLQSRDRGAAPTGRFEGTLRTQIDRVEEQLIRQTLADNDYNVTNAAKALDISRQQLYLKLRKYGITPRPE
jgi:transcriptional regulator with GAF, ATPase, and Fis domain